MAAQFKNQKSKIKNTYWEFSQRPLQSLVFLLPLTLAYELALPILGSDDLRRVSEDIYARRLLSSFFEWFGVTGYSLPGVIMAAVLVSWHIARKDPWKIDGRFCLLMGAESALLAIPLFVFMLVLVRHPMVAARFTWLASVGEGPSWQAQLMFGIGAGIYEELLFRLIAIAFLHMILVDLLALPAHIGAIGSIALSAVAFALYHFPSLSDVEMGKLMFYTAAGVYLAGVYVVRGFGIAAATHAVYDVMVVLLQIRQAQG